jgi:hypothetical protein
MLLKIDFKFIKYSINILIKIHRNGMTFLLLLKLLRYIFSSVSQQTIVDFVQYLKFIIANIIQQFIRMYL